MRRALIKAAVFLLLGAIVNIAVAWGCTLNSHWQHWPHIGDADLVEVCHRHLTPACSTDIEIDRAAAGFACRSIMLSGRSTCPPELWAVVCDVRSGWPVMSLQGQSWLMRMKDESSGWSDPTYGWINLDGLDIGRKPAGTTHHGLPFMPLWPGFAINTLFYAAILWLIFVAPFALRHRMRTKRGQCPACAYPIGVSDRCTECGAPLPARATTNSSRSSLGAGRCDV